MIVEIILLLVSIVIYMFAPGVYSYNYCVLTFVVFLVSSLWVIRKRSNGNYFNFHVLFLISYFFVNFVYPVFLFPVDKYYFPVFNYDFNENLISKSTALAMLGSSAYTLGAAMLRIKSDYTFEANYRPMQFARFTGILKLLTYAFFGLFLAFVGRDFFSGIFNSGTSSSNYFLIGFQSLVALTVTVVCYTGYYRSSEKMTFWKFVGQFDKVFLGFMFLFILLFFFIGDRGPALQVFLILVTLYAVYVKKVKLKVFLLGASLGMFLMLFISSARVTRTSGFNDSNSIGGFLERGSSNMKFNSIFDLGMDLTMNNRNLYVAVDYADKNGINYGKTMITQVVGIVPGLQPVVLSMLGMTEDEMSSGRIINKLTIGDDATWGVGTNLIGDIYLSFGVLGVVAFMLFFGYIHTRFQQKMLYSQDINYVIAYVISMSFAIYYPRASYFSAFRNILWPIILLAIIRFMTYKRQRTTTKLIFHEDISYQ
ncbi:oligosaccharide repeat unit polymerase [Chitinophaga sp. W3I9]|uniref:O-antigen polysaccharide polymerase Wzy n=1 Tax=Chitinophaga sp. W3I9 TaxID=3373924 RepID=UPI003D1C521E